MRELDRRFVSDIVFLLQRDGPETLALAVLRAADKIGFRGWLENEIGNEIIKRAAGRRAPLRLVSGDPDDDGPDDAA
jgi:hypothetical protein